MLNRRTFGWSLAAAMLGYLGSAVFAFTPPVDTAGPLRVRIEGPEEVTQIDTPLAVRVLLENRGDTPLEGTLRLGVIDSWRVEPAEAVRFAVEAKASASRQFRVVAGEGTYSAHYPIHAQARFELDGRTHVAHPILIVETKVPRRPRAPAALEWKPARMPETGELAVWNVPVHRAIVAVFGQEPQTMPVGWQGTEARTGGSVRIQQHALAGEAREVIAIHPPWQKGLAGTLAVEFPVQLPKTRPLVLRFANGVIPEGQGDGVTFRVRVLGLEAPAGELGRVVFERHSAAHAWQAGEADLSAFAGQAVRVQLESHPGPKNNTSWDSSFWAEPTLVAGTLPAGLPFPPAEPAGSRVLGTAGPPDRPSEVRLWPGRRGLLDAVVGFGAGPSQVCFRGFQVRVLGGRIDDPRSPILLRETKEEPCPGGCQVRHRFESHAGGFELVVRLWVEQGVLRARFGLENAPDPKPWQVVRLEDVAAGPWSRPVHQVYAGMGNVIRRPETFRLGFDGHQLSTSFIGLDFAGGPSLAQAVDVPPDRLEVRPTDAHYSLHVPHASTWTFIPADNAFEAARLWHDANGLKAAAGVRQAAGRFVFDLWGGRYGQTAESLRRAFRYGLTDAMVIFHNWQRWGYDYRLPDIYPPNPNLGTLEEMQELIRACKQAGVRIAPHDNYIDFYPDADEFSYQRHIAFHQEGTPVRAWLNQGRQAQSYRFRADTLGPFLQRNLKRIRDGLAPDAYFIDVWSSIGPYDYWTADGKFFDRVFTRTSWGEHFDWIRRLLGDDAPQISESGHDQLIGWLDGAQTNHLRVGKPGPGRNAWCVWNIRCEDAERTPWFDAAHHDRFVLHGAGYPSRYEGGLEPRLHGIYSDDYLATEVLTGHPAMVSEPFGRNVVRKYWLLQALMRALALRRIEAVQYVGGDLHRQHVRWSGRAEVWVNRGQSDWPVGEATLPPYGFLAKAPTQAGLVQAAIQRRDGLVVESASWPEGLYVNGRQVVDEALPIRLSVLGARLAEGRRLELSLQWQADAPLPAGWTPFLHFCDPEGEIVFQVSHQPGRFETAQQGTIAASAMGHVPETLSAGQTFELRAGIYHAQHGRRLALAGADDGGRRIRLGTIRLEGEGDRLAGVAWAPHKPEPDPWLARQNPHNKPVDFGAVTTAGGFCLTRQDDRLVVTPLPGTPGGKACVRIVWAALPWRLGEPVEVESLAEDGRVLARQPVRRQAGAIVLDCSPEVFGYRLTSR